MDQASLLRELMNKSKSEGKIQSAKAGSVAFIATSGVYEVKEFLKSFVRYCGKKLQKNITLMGLTESNVLELEDCILERTEIDKTKVKLTTGTDCIPGTLDILAEVVKNKYLMQNFLRIMEEIETQTDNIFYYAGSGMDLNAIKLSLITNRVVIVMKPDEKSFSEACNYIKVFSKTGSSERAGVIVDTSDFTVFQEHFNKLQEFCQSQFKYNIEPIGYYEMKYISVYNDEYEIFKKFNLNYLADSKHAKIFSEFVEKIM